MAAMTIAWATQGNDAMDAISVEVHGMIGHIARQRIDSNKHSHINNRPQHRRRAKAKVDAAGTTQTSSVSPQRIRRQQHRPQEQARQHRAC
eukprot:2442841-Pyramimonas_sp.AAC.1